MKRLVIVLLLLGTSLAQKKAAPKAPKLSFRGVTPGVSTLGDVEQRHEVDCKTVGDGSDDKVLRCSKHEDRLTAFYVLNVGSHYILTKAYFEIYPVEFDDFVAALRARYGPPSMAREHLQNRFGATFVGRFATWTDGRRTLSIWEYDGSLYSGSVLLVDNKLNPAVEAATRYKPKID